MSDYLPAIPAGHGTDKILSAADNLLAMHLGSRAPETQRKYRSALGRLACLAGLHDGEAWVRAAIARGVVWTSSELARHAAHRLAAGFAPKTVRLDLSAAQSVLGLLAQLGVISWRPVLPNVRPERRNARSGPAPAGVAALLAITRRDLTPVGRRDHAVVCLLHDAGLRRQEVATMRRDGLVLDGPPSCRVVRKGRREASVVALGARAAGAVAGWLEVAPESDLVFPTCRDGKTIWSIVRRRAAEAGLPVTRPHGLRHSGATQVARMGLKPLLAYGGWSSPTSAMPYLDDMDAERRRAIAELENPS